MSGRQGGREGRGGGRGNSVEKGLAVRREKEEAVKFEKDVSAGPDYRGLWSSQTFYHPRHQNQPRLTAGGLVAAWLSPGPGPRPQDPLTWQAGCSGPGAQEAGPARPPAAAPCSRPRPADQSHGQPQLCGPRAQSRDSRLSLSI